MGQYYFFDMTHPSNFAVLVNDARTTKVYHFASPNSAVTSLLITKMRVANADIQDNSSINSDCSTPVTPIQDYGERKEENNIRRKLQGYTLQVPK